MSGTHEDIIGPDLLSRLKEGDRKAFFVVYNMYMKKLYRYSLKFVHSQDLAQEIVQTVFIRLWEYRANINIDKPLDGYLYVITRNAAMDYLRKAALDDKLKKEIWMHYPLLGGSPEMDLMYSQYKEYAEKAISQLPPVRKKVFNLRYQQEMSYDEIAQHLNISKNTVKTHLLKATHFVKEYLKIHTDLTVVTFIISVLFF